MSMQPTNEEEARPVFTKYRFRRVASIGLLIAFLLAIAIPVLFYIMFEWPDSYSMGSRIAVSILALLIMIMLWMVLYRNSRPKTDEYHKRRNLIGRGLILISFVLLGLTVIVNYFLVSSQTVADLTFTEYWTAQCITNFGLTLVDTLTSFGRFLGNVRFQVALSLVYVGVALGYSPLLSPGLIKQSRSRATLWLAVAIFWVILVSILSYLGQGYVWRGTEGQIYLIEGLYPQQFTIFLIPNLIFLFFGSVVYFRSRQYFWSELAPEQHRTAGKWFIVAGLGIFNILFSFSPIYPEFLVKDTALAYAVFLLLNAFLSFGVILTIQANWAVMGGKPSRNIVVLSRLFWLLFLLGLAGYGYLFVFSDGINADVGELFAYIPNLVFSMVLTGGMYYGGLWIQAKKAGANCKGGSE